MRWFFLIFGFVVLTTVWVARERGDKFSEPPFEMFPDMDHQYKLRFQTPSKFFENGQGARKPVEGTVPMGYHFPIEKDQELTSDMDFSTQTGYLGTGMVDEYFGSGYPEEIEFDQAFLERGRERYQINCVVCHGESGNGKGIVSQYWMMPPTANLVDERAKALPEGQIFWTITNGKGLMGPYKGNITVKDRWAITAYVRALQQATN